MVEGVILLHGLARTRRSMRSMAVFLEQRGYIVVNVNYPSRRDSIETLARTAIPPAMATMRGQVSVASISSPIPWAASCSAPFLPKNPRPNWAGW